MRVTFSGINDIRFPKGTNVNVITEKYNDLKNYADKKYPSFNNGSMLDIELKDTFYKSDEFAPKGIRIISPVENPYIMADILSRVDESLVQQYIDQTKTQLVVPV